MEKKVSVIIPFYNGADWLCEAVQSVLDQTYKNFEIIVVNDGSPENIEPFLEKFGDKVIYRYKENGGAATARNLALSIATGDYIAFLDSDDIWLPEKTEKQIAFMKERGAMWSHTGYYNWYPNTQKDAIMNNNKDFGNVYSQSFLSLKAPTPAIIIKRECFNIHTDFFFFEDMRKAQDSALWSRISYYYPIGLLKEPFVKIRQKGDNSDLSSIIRFEIKSKIFEKVNNGEYINVSMLIKAILFYYVIGNRILKKISNMNIVKKNTVEEIGKILWIFPFLIERMYVVFLYIGKERKFKQYHS